MMLSMPRGDWDALTTDQQIGLSQSIPTQLGEPALMVNDTGQEWVCWDDDRFTETDIAILAIQVDDPSLIPLPEDDE